MHAATKVTRYNWRGKIYGEYTDVTTTEYAEADGNISDAQSLNVRNFLSVDYHSVAS